jgi:hypothetical protein
MILENPRGHHTLQKIPGVQSLEDHFITYWFITVKDYWAEGHNPQVGGSYPCGCL